MSPTLERHQIIIGLGRAILNSKEPVLPSRSSSRAITRVWERVRSYSTRPQSKPVNTMLQRLGLFQTLMQSFLIQSEDAAGEIVSVIAKLIPHVGRMLTQMDQQVALTVAFEHYPATSLLEYKAKVSIERAKELISALHQLWSCYEVAPDYFARGKGWEALADAARNMLEAWGDIRTKLAAVNISLQSPHDIDQQSQDQILYYLEELLQYAQNFQAAITLSEDATLQLIVVLLPPIRDDELLLGLVREACGDSEARTAIRKSVMQSVVPGTEVTSASMEDAVLEAFQEAVKVSSSPKQTNALHRLLCVTLTLRKLPESCRVTVEISPSQSSHNAVTCTLQQVQWRGTVVSVQTTYFPIPATNESSELWLRTLREVTLWRQLEHPNIVPFRGVGGDMLGHRPTFQVVSDRGDRCSIMDSIALKDLRDLKELRPIWIMQIASAIAYVHERGIVHGDLRCDNISVDRRTLSALLSGFHHAILLGANNELEALVGHAALDTPDIFLLPWMAPELAKSGGKDRTFASDVFAFGRTCFEIYSDMPPFGNVSRNQMCEMLVNGEHSARPTGQEASTSKAQRMPDALWDLVGRCWSDDPGKRPTMTAIVKELSDMFPVKN